MKKLFLVSVALGALVAGPAVAADLAVKARPLPPVPVFSWAGFYIGGHGGCAHERKDYALGPFTDNDPGGVGSFFVVDPSTADGGGCYGGIQGGYNWQVANWVLGIEADASWGRIRSGNTVLNEVELGDLVENLAIFSQRLSSFGTVRGRVGPTWNWGSTAVLIYGTAGWAWARNELTTTAFEAPGVPAGTATITTNSQTHNGWTAGVGLEVAFAYNWSLKAEYLYMDFGSKRYASLFWDDGAVPGGTFADIHLKMNTVRVGLNYRFGGYGGVMAAY